MRAKVHIVIPAKAGLPSIRLESVRRALHGPSGSPDDGSGLRAVSPVWRE